MNIQVGWQVSFPAGKYVSALVAVVSAAPAVPWQQHAPDIAQPPLFRSSPAFARPPGIGDGLSILTQGKVRPAR